MTSDHHHHHHDHDHHHHSQDDSAGDGGMNFAEKLIRRIEHWIAHNHDHVNNYRDWARRAGESEFHEAAALLEATAEKTDAVSRKLEEALKAVKSSR